jgi:hypothetical protein
MYAPFLVQYMFGQKFAFKIPGQDLRPNEDIQSDVSIWTSKISLTCRIC